MVDNWQNLVNNTCIILNNTEKIQTAGIKENNRLKLTQPLGISEPVSPNQRNIKTTEWQSHCHPYSI